MLLNTAPHKSRYGFGRSIHSTLRHGDAARHEPQGCRRATTRRTPSCGWPGTVEWEPERAGPLGVRRLRPGHPMTTLTASADHSLPSSGPRGAPRPSPVKIGRSRSVTGGYFQTRRARAPRLRPLAYRGEVSTGACASGLAGAKRWFLFRYYAKANSKAGRERSLTHDRLQEIGRRRIPTAATIAPTISIGIPRVRPPAAPTLVVRLSLPRRSRPADHRAMDTSQLHHRHYRGMR